MNYRPPCRYCLSVLNPVIYSFSIACSVSLSVCLSLCLSVSVPVSVSLSLSLLLSVSLSTPSHSLSLSLPPPTLSLSSSFFLFLSPSDHSPLSLTDRQTDKQRERERAYLHCSDILGTILTHSSSLTPCTLHSCPLRTDAEDGAREADGGQGRAVQHQQQENRGAPFSHRPHQGCLPRRLPQHHLLQPARQCPQPLSHILRLQLRRSGSGNSGGRGQRRCWWWRQW